MRKTLVWNDKIISQVSHLENENLFRNVSHYYSILHSGRFAHRNFIPKNRILNYSNTAQPQKSYNDSSNSQQLLLQFKVSYCWTLLSNFHCQRKKTSEKELRKDVSSAAQISSSTTTTRKRTGVWTEVAEHQQQYGWRVGLVINYGCSRHWTLSW